MTAQCSSTASKGQPSGGVSIAPSAHPAQECLVGGRMQDYCYRRSNAHGGHSSCLAVLSQSVRRGTYVLR